MSFFRQILAVFLSVFLATPVWAAENTKKKVGDKDYPYFKIGVRPVDDSQFVDWEKECVVLSSEDSVPVRLEYKSSVDGKIKVSIPGIIRPGEEIVVDKYTKRALRVRKCGNGITQPTDWIPVGELRCLPTVATSEAEVVPEPISDPEPVAVKPLIIPREVVPPAPEPVLPKVVEKPKKGNAWLYVVGVVVVGGLVAAFASKGSDKKPSGGPAGDPRN